MAASCLRRDALLPRHAPPTLANVTKRSDGDGKLRAQRSFASHDNELRATHSLPRATPLPPSNQPARTMSFAAAGTTRLLASSCIWLSVATACSHEGSLSNTETDSERDAPTERSNRTPDGGTSSEGESQLVDASDEVALPGTPFEFTLGGRVYLDLSIPAVIEAPSGDSLAWDLLFDELSAYTNSGAVGPGFAASFGPSSELDLLFDSAPAVPLRADVSENAMLDWYWFGPNGVTSRFHTYGVRDASGRLFKLQVLSYYDTSTDEPRSATYSLRYAEVRPDENGETVELDGIDASAGGITLPPSAPAGCVQLASGTLSQLAPTQWATTSWDLCFQRTEIFLNDATTGDAAVDGVKVVDLDVAPGAPDGGVTPSEQQQTAQGALARFDELDYAALTSADIRWDRKYSALARIGTRWLRGQPDDPSPTVGSWIIRGANGQSHYALYFTDIARAANDTSTVRVQVKPVSPPTITE